MSDIPRSPARFFGEYVPAHFAALESSLKERSSPGSIARRANARHVTPTTSPLPAGHGGYRPWTAPPSRSNGSIRPSGSSIKATTARPRPTTGQRDSRIGRCQ